MVQITLTIPDDKVQTVKDGILALYPVPTELDEDGNPTPVMSENAWLKEWLRRKVRDEVARGLQKLAKEAITFDPDDTIVS
jgi:hypothetical protein